MLAKEAKSNLIFILILIATFSIACQDQAFHVDVNNQHAPTSLAEIHVIQLPAPDLDGATSLEETLAERRSVRNFQDEPLSQSQIGQLLWAAQGITHPAEYRTAPSAGALYPLEIYTATEDGLFHYTPQEHSLTQVLEGDLRSRLYEAALEQESVREAPLVIVITGIYARTIAKYGEDRAPLYVHLEAGHAAQNILLQAVALGLGAVPIGGFYEDQIKEALKLPKEQTPLYLIPVGQPE
ncbi:MAG: SagB/ThcOx family dehydrogenase [Brevefilum sp.]